jgi:N-methylhydantoinase A
MLVAPRSVEFTRSLIAPLDALDWPEIDRTLADLSARGRAILEEGGISSDEIAHEVSADMRYAGQGFEVTVPLDSAVVKAHDGGALRAAFLRRYEERFARSLAAAPVEIVSWRVRAVAPPAVDEVRFAGAEDAGGDPLIERRPTFFDGGFVETPVYARARLAAGARIEGPALIEEAESTAVIGPGASVTVDEHGNLLMTLYDQGGKP